MTFSPEELERRRQRIHEVKPWERSTGAKSPEGKLRSSQNALKHGKYSMHDPLRILAKWQREEEEMERFRAIAKTMREAYSKSDAAIPERWEQIFEIMDKDEFINIWRSL